MNEREKRIFFIQFLSDGSENDNNDNIIKQVFILDKQLKNQRNDATDVCLGYLNKFQLFKITHEEIFR